MPVHLSLLTPTNRYSPLSQQQESPLPTTHTACPLDDPHTHTRATDTHTYIHTGARNKHHTYTHEPIDKRTKQNDCLCCTLLLTTNLLFNLAAKLYSPFQLSSFFASTAVKPLSSWSSPFSNKSPMFQHMTLVRHILHRQILTQFDHVVVVVSSFGLRHFH